MSSFSRLKDLATSNKQRAASTSNEQRTAVGYAAKLRNGTGYAAIEKQTREEGASQHSVIYRDIVTNFPHILWVYYCKRRYGMPAHRGNGDDATTTRSAGSGRSRVPLSARSARSANSMHADSYSYLSDRVYNFLKARSAWKQRVQSEEAGDEGVQETLKVGIQAESTLVGVAIGFDYVCIQ